MTIDFNKGVKKETMTLVEFNKTLPEYELTGANTVTVYSIDEVAERNYCRKHQGLVKVGGEVFEWTEDCNCV